MSGYYAAHLRHLEPADNPDHDPDDPACACDECDQIAADLWAERVADAWRDETV